MTLSEQTNNTTSNTPHVVRRSDSLFPPPPPFFRVVRFHFCFLRFGAFFSFAPPGCVGWGPFCSGRDLSHGSSASCMSFSCAVQLFVMFRSAVLCPLCGFAFPVGLRPFGLLVFLSVASVCASLGFRCFCCAPLWVWEGPAFFWLGDWHVLAPLPVSCYLPSRRGWSRVAPWPSFHAGTFPLGIWLQL